MADIKSLVRVGFVSDIDTANGTARVAFPDMNDMVSDWLYIMRYPGMYVTINDEQKTVTDWFPAVNDKVLVLMAYGFNSDGFILGVIQ